MEDDSAPIFSFVLPAYNELPNLEALTGRLIGVGEGEGEPFEILWVDDGSTDGSGARLDEMAEGDSRIRVIHLTRNFGHMAALTAGLEWARGSGAVITLDADGEQPPESIPEMIRKWREGAGIVQTIRNESSVAGATKRATSALFYRIFNFLSDIRIPQGAADFRLMDRQVVDTLNEMPEHIRFVRGLVHWVGYTVEYVHYDPMVRLGGKSKYGYLHMVSLALSGITSFSMRPLRLSFLMALFVILFTVIYAAYILYHYFVGEPLTPGWTSMILTIMLLAAAQLFAIGVASEYLARIFVEQKARPVYIVRKTRPKGSDGPRATSHE